MSQHAYDVTVADFDQKVLAASQQAPVLVDFWAPWCQPCTILKPILEKLAAELGGQFILAKVNSDENQELAARYGVRGIPAVKAFVDGQLVDEFTGALPEAQIREFLGRLMPSPAEPLRKDALAAYALGDLDAARKIMAEAINLDPKNDNAYLDFVEMSLAANALDEARELLDVIADRASDTARVASLQAQLQLAVAGGGADVAALQAEVADKPDALEARLQLANALAVAQDYRGAFEQLIEIVRRDRSWNEEAGRKTMLTLFNLLAAQPQFGDLVREFRVMLSRTLN
ncbi:MAG: tetratricopeptide repeat protein [Gammaproteobacteria bacterium]|nr:tetratricopeptide repeat protein [Rhodocyclaceae bacterium]MBU3908660.1 tetratricopeptide repeat protein [Gammaproteobacteria bacterium]MBU3988975.1 tetratricopeptide repeat protein [Gammaproteobacteria bacterium]MBU4004688.1 tetratricopeptide repeat protein [Gammaproteobacteria bacterium]MBU4021291.1 tetratricopeptide repeat protein [Gammaproteobacteria bacterium]